jgi:hypothetical protein
MAPPFRLYAVVYRGVPGLSFGPIVSLQLSCCDLSVRENAQPRAWSEGDVSAEHCLQGEAGELAGLARVRQARPSRACFGSQKPYIFFNGSKT